MAWTDSAAAARVGMTGFTIGVDYERRLSRMWGIGVLADVAVGEIKREAVLGVPVFLHP